MRRRLAECLIFSLLTIGFGIGPTYADLTADPCASATLGQAHGVCVLGGSASTSLIATSGPTGDGHHYELRPQCGIDDGGQEVCYGTQPCTADDGQPGTMMDLYRDGEPYGQTCLSNTQSTGLGVITPAMVLREFTRLAWPQSPLSIEPPGLKTAVNLETYYFTDNTQPSSQTVKIIGQDVQIEATPSSYLYRFDDTDSTHTTSPGAAYPTGDVTHTYLYKGTATPSIDTTYTGRYRINGGPWTNIPEPLTVTGAPVTLDIIEIRPTLVAPNIP